MGRSQVKYRATHGRGRGRGRGEATEGQNETVRKHRRGHLRNLGSNAYRFEEYEEKDENEEGAQVINLGERMQFFASEKTYRDKGRVAPSEYFQSLTMKQWEKAGDDGTDNGEAFGMLDLNWIASQLKHVPPDIRYRMDPKYCIDIPFKPLDENVEKAYIEADGDIASAMITCTAPKPTESNPKDDAELELDFLLELSEPTCSGDDVTFTVPASLHVVSAATEAPVETGQLEDWLDDVLDM